MARNALPASLLRRTAGVCGVTFALLGAAACDQSSSPLVAPVAAPALASGASAPGHLHSNSVKYRDSSRPRATGRSGNAVLTGYAVRDGDAVRLTLSSGRVGQSGVQGIIARAQVKAYTADGTLLFTQNYQRIEVGQTTLLLPSLPPGARLDVQANVRGIDGRRTDVVELTDQVRSSPSLMADLSLAPQATVGAPTVISGIVGETSGDLGIRADLLLLVDGVEVDRASSIWVDAGDSVSFAFVHTFTAAGEYDVEVRVAPLPDPGYPTPDPISDAASIDAVLPTTQGSWSATAEDRWRVHAWTYEYSWADSADSKEYRNSESETTRTQSVAIQGTAARALGSPLGLDLELRSGGLLRHEEHWSGLVSVPDSLGRLCLSRDIVEQGSALLVCTWGSGASAVTSYSYTRFAKQITYHSDGYSWTFYRTWTDGGTWDNTYTEYGGGGQPWTWGSELYFQLVLRDAAGQVVINPVVGLTPFEQLLGSQPLTCSSSPWASRPWVTISECRSSEDRVYGVSGSGSGIG